MTPAKRSARSAWAAAADGFPARIGAQYVSRWILFGSRRTSAVAAAAAARSASTPRNVQRSRSDSAGACAGIKHHGTFVSPRHRRDVMYDSLGDLRTGVTAQKSSNLTLRTCASRGAFDRM